MIIEIDRTQICLPFNEGQDLCMDGGFLNPLAFKSKFRTHTWYPFEDLYLDHGNILRITEKSRTNRKMYRQTMPCRGSECKYYSIIDPSRLDVNTICDWINYDEGIIWFDDGNMVMNSFSDFVLLSLDKEFSRYVFGVDASTMYSESRSIFTEPNPPSPIKEFLLSIRP